MKEYLITSSILDSFDWYMTAPVSWKQRAADDLKNQLFRIYTTLGPAQQRGVDFEKSNSFGILSNLYIDTPPGRDFLSYLQGIC